MSRQGIRVRVIDAITIAADGTERPATIVVFGSERRCYARIDGEVVEVPAEECIEVTANDS